MLSEAGLPDTVIQGDCLEVMAGLPDECLDAVVTDPPFGIGFDYDGRTDVAAHPAAYWTWLRPRYEQALRCLRPGGFVAIWQAQLYFRYFWDWFGPDIHIYCAAKNFVQMRATAINFGYDPVIMRYKPGAEPLRPAAPQRSVDFFVANTAGVIGDVRRAEKAHPCPRPLDQVGVIVANFTLPGGLVLDPFAGSGTTAAACIQEGRHYVLIEQEPQYALLCQQRISTAQPALPLALADEHCTARYTTGRG